MFFIAALAAMAVAGAEAAPSAPAATQDKPAAVAKPKTKRVCTTMEVTGGRLPQKHCVTVKVRDEEPAANADAPKS